MKKFGLTVAVASLAIALAATAVNAGAAAKKKKIGFFQSLFGGQTERTKERRRKSVFGNKWWEEDANNNGGVRIISGSEGDITKKNRRRIITIDDDPEGDSGFGMGNLTYVPDRVVALGGAVFATPRPDDPARAAIYDSLSDAALGLRLPPEARDAILKLYYGHDFRAVWLENGGLSPRGQAVLKLLSEADQEGLRAEDYLPPVLAGFDAPLPSDPDSLAKLDIALTAMALKYARHASGGQFDPRRLSLYHDVTPEWVTSSQAVKVLAWSPYPAEYLANLHPKHPAYALLKAELRKAMTAPIEPPPEPIADGKIIKLGKSDDRLPLIRDRLLSRGYGPAPDAEAGEDALVLDKELTARIKRFQQDSGIKATGQIGPQTIGALNGDKRIDHRQALMDNMERLRWLPKNLGSRYVFVNQAGFRVDVMKDGKVEWTSKVIVGKPNTQTAVFNDEMETVVFNPSWGVPQSIIRNEYLPKLRNDPGYLDRIGFKVVNGSGKVVRSSSVDWWGYDSASIGIQQPPGDDNALGELKFLFPNSHDIYMHDTPSRHLFDNQVRAFSHGCVRVQNPREFASVLLGWNELQVAETVESRKSQSVKLKAKIPVHIAYFTAWPDESGGIAYFNDIYGRDKTLEEARSALTVAQR